MNAKPHQSSSRTRTTGTKIPKLHSVHEGHVTSVQSFGVFVQLGKGDTYKDALLHVSNVGPKRIESPKEGGLEMGTRIWVKVNDINDKELKYGLDMRYVSQIDGKDLDPYNGKAKMPDNGWYRGVFEEFRPKDEPEEDERPPAPASPLAAKKRKASEDEDDSDQESTVSSDVGKKLKKARKKLEKMKRKAEKKEKKKSKKATKEGKEGKKSKKTKKESSASDASPAPSSRSS